MRAAAGDADHAVLARAPERSPGSPRQWHESSSVVASDTDGDRKSHVHSRQSRRREGRRKSRHGASRVPAMPRAADRTTLKQGRALTSDPGRSQQMEQWLWSRTRVLPTQG